MLNAYVQGDWQPLCLNSIIDQSKVPFASQDYDPDFGPVTSNTKDTFSLDHLPDRDL